MDSKREQTINWMFQHTHNQDSYDLYFMNTFYDYNLDNITDLITKHAESGNLNESLINDAIYYEALGEHINQSINLGSFGCTAFKMDYSDGTHIMGRNYDFINDTSCMVVFCRPKGENKVSSMAFAALDNLNVNNLDNYGARKNCLAAPFACLDGINSAGVSIAVLTLDTPPTYQKQIGKPYITPTLAIRAVLDNAHSAKEAVDIMHSYNMYATGGRDYHFFITDNKGDAHVVEYDSESEAMDNFFDLTLVKDKTGKYVPIECATNFCIKYIDRIDQKNPNVYGHGKDRYDKVINILEEHKRSSKLGDEWDALEKSSQEKNISKPTSNTQWSLIDVNNHHATIIALRRDFDHKYSIRFSAFTDENIDVNIENS